MNETEIDVTIAQLLENADALEEIVDNPLFSNESRLLHLAQESLLAHLLALGSGQPVEKEALKKHEPYTRRSVKKLAKHLRPKKPASRRKCKIRSCITR